MVSAATVAGPQRRCHLGRDQHYLAEGTASITEAKNNLSALIDGLKNGSPVLIVDRGRPVARLEPVITADQGGQDGRLVRLLRDGVVRHRRTEPLRALFSSPRRAQVPAHRRSMCSSKSDGKDGEILGCLNDRAAVGRRTDDAALASARRRDPDMLVWWGSEVECVSALARLERTAALDAKGMALASSRLIQLANSWHEIEPSEMVRESAIRFLRVHPLRAADGLQLAAAFIAAERCPSSLEVITLGEPLADAALKEGFALVDLTAG